EESNWRQKPACQPCRDNKRQARKAEHQDVEQWSVPENCRRRRHPGSAECKPPIPLKPPKPRPFKKTSQQTKPNCGQHNTPCWRRELRRIRLVLDASSQTLIIHLAPQPSRTAASSVFKPLPARSSAAR